MEAYKCTLSRASLAKAKDELAEDPSKRLQAVDALREWIKEQEHISIITSTKSLLRYLRKAKFNQYEARELVVGHLELRTNFPQWYQNVDPGNPDHIRALTKGVVVPLPGFDSDGRKIILFRHGAIDKQLRSTIRNDKDSKNDFFKGFFMVLLYLLDSENIQVNGFVHLNDFTGVTMDHFKMISLDNFKDLMKWQEHLPGRFKRFLYYNTGSVFESIMSVLKPFMGEKFQDRVKIIRNNLEKMHEEIPIEMLPEEYLPDDYEGPNSGSLQNIIDETVKAVQSASVRDRIRYETDPKWGITQH